MTKKRPVRGKKAATTPVKEEKSEVKDEVDVPEAKDEAESLSEVKGDTTEVAEGDADGGNEVKQDAEKEEDGNVVIELQLSDAKDSEENGDQQGNVDEEDDGIMLTSNVDDTEDLGDAHEEDMADENQEDVGNTEPETEAEVEDLTVEPEGDKNEPEMKEEAGGEASEVADVKDEKDEKPIKEESSDKDAGTTVEDANDDAEAMDESVKDTEGTDDKTEEKEGEGDEGEGEEEEESANQNEEDDLHKVSQSDHEMINEKFKLPAYPESLSKLTKLTVTIGPIQQVDLHSSELHKILSLIMDFEIKFEGKEKTLASGRITQEKLGYVRTQFKIRTPSYLVKMATLLGNLNIRGRDMSVKFPEVFNMAVKDCKEYESKNRSVVAKIMKEKHAYILELKKRRILVKNIPENTTEDTMKALFPECLTVDFREEESGNKKLCSAVLTFENEKACNECFESNKDVEIGDSKVLIKKLYDHKMGQFRKPGNQSRWGFRGGRGGFMGRGGGMPFRGGRFPNRGGGMMAGRRPDMGPRPGPALSSAPFNKSVSPQGRGKFASNVNQSRNQSSDNQARKRSDSGPQSRPAQNRPNNDRRSLGANSPKSQRPFNKSPETKGQFGMGFGNRQNKPANRRGMNSGQGQGQFSQGGFQSGNMMRNNQFGQGGQLQGASRNTEEDPMAMMAYLKNTIAKMEEKITQRDNYGGGNDGGSSNFNNRKRRGGMLDQHTNAKRQNFQDKRGDNFGNKGFQGVQQNYGGGSSGYTDSNSFTGTTYDGNYGSTSNYSGGGGQNYSNNYGGNNSSNFGYGNQGNRSNYSGNQQSNSGRYGGGNW